MNSNFDETRSFSIPSEATNSAERIIMAVYQALKAKGYDPITQIVGYILSRSLIKRLERDEILEELVRFYVMSGEKNGRA